MLPEGFHLFYEDENVRMGSWHNVAVAVWWGSPTAETVRRVIALEDELVLRAPQGLLYCNIAVQGRPNFTKEMRQAVEALVEKHSESTVASAQVILLDGLVATTVRSFLAALLLFIRARFPMKIFSDLESGAKWLVESKPDHAEQVPFGSEQLVSVFRRLMER